MKLKDEKGKESDEYPMKVFIKYKNNTFVPKAAPKVVLPALPQPVIKSPVVVIKSTSEMTDDELNKE